MAESKQKTHHVLLSTDGKKTTVELFNASLWPDKSSNDGEFRIRINGKWYCAAGKFTFLPYRAVGELISTILAGGVLHESEKKLSALRVHQRVRVHYGECFSSTPCFATNGLVVAPPFRGVDGRWRVFVSAAGETRDYLLHDVDITPNPRAICK